MAGLWRQIGECAGSDTPQEQDLERGSLCLVQWAEKGVQKLCNVRRGQEAVIEYLAIRLSVKAFGRRPGRVAHFDIDIAQGGQGLSKRGVGKFNKKRATRVGATLRRTFCSQALPNVGRPLGPGGA